MHARQNGNCSYSNLKQKTSIQTIDKLKGYGIIVEYTLGVRYREAYDSWLVSIRRQPVIWSCKFLECFLFIKNGVGRDYVLISGCT